MTTGKINFRDSCTAWKKTLQVIAQENEQLRMRVEKERKHDKPGLEYGLQHFENRFNSQRQVIGLLLSQLKDLYAAYEKGAANTDPAFAEQVEGFKMDIDRVVLLFSRLKAQFKAYLDEYTK